RGRFLYDEICMNESIDLESPAKVNLRLEILRKREDGYHEIKTILQKISLQDTLYFSLRKEKGVSIKADSPNLPTGKANLVYKAVQSMMIESGYRGGILIEIKKRIPLGAGLGGGSSNAATTLKAMNQLLNLNISKKRLMEMGLEIGADVPFFFLEGAAVGSGIGERLRKVELPVLWFVLIYPNFEVSTRWAYQNFVLTRSTGQCPTFGGEIGKHCSGSTLSKPEPLGWRAEGLTNQRIHFNLQKFTKTPEGISRIFLNHLEEVVSEKYPQIESMKKILCSAGALAALMSGSGPTVFGIFSDEQSSTEAYGKIKGLVKRRGWIVFKAKSITA
ncbi:MAG TPA: 4-(cytidine 5'-diphospho)-2-C-methyl-D-erythritol kinase, partial [Thermodesulfobacteriota bacterium]|nr:4-(cytidine 5'-diphospho)-2-C-methyl-D-erythritol kinase [Thermodesulfobacteriota bacterium]